MKSLSVFSRSILEDERSEQSKADREAKKKEIADDDKKKEQDSEKAAQDKAADKEQNKLKLEIISTDNDVLVISKDGEHIGFKPTDIEFSKFSSKFSNMLKVSKTTALEWLEQNANKVSIDK